MSATAAAGVLGGSSDSGGGGGNGGRRMPAALASAMPSGQVLVVGDPSAEHSRKSLRQQAAAVEDGRAPATHYSVVYLQGAQCVTTAAATTLLTGLPPTCPGTAGDR